MNGKIRTLCTTRHGDKQSCEVSMKSPSGFGDVAWTRLFNSKNYHKGANTVQKIQAENQETMHNLAW
jgi:hypothetical protein